MKNLKLKVLSTVAALSLAVSCGKDSGSGGSGGSGGTRQAQEPAPVDGSNIDGHYQAKFITMNPHVNGTIPGSANFHRKEDKLYVYVRLFAGGVRAWHMQHVYTGGRCPTMKDDRNGDGFVDIQEAEKVLGKILIPLDSNISSQSAGRRFFPLADLSGYYHYERITSFRRFLQDLQDEDREPEDDVVKLAAGEGLRLAGKTVLIQGVTETVDLPETVASKGRHAAFQTLPIVCGVFNKLPDKEPGTPYVMDRIPGPIADVVEGQDRPADDVIPETTGGTSGGSGSGTNDSDDGDGPVSDGEGRTSGGSSDNESGSSTTGGSSTGRTSGGSSSGSTSGGTSSGSTSGGSSSGSESTSSSTTGGTTGSSSSSTTTGGSSTTTTSSSSSSSSSSVGSTTGGLFGF